jgi:hypothetical protein
LRPVYFVLFTAFYDNCHLYHFKGRSAIDAPFPCRNTGDTVVATKGNYRQGSVVIFHYVVDGKSEYCCIRSLYKPLEFLGVDSNGAVFLSKGGVKGEQQLLPDTILTATRNSIIIWKRISH